MNSFAGESVDVNSFANVTENPAARVILKCPGKSEATKLVLLPKTMQELLELGGKKFECHCTKVVSVEGAEIDEIELIRDGDQLSLICND